MLRSETFYGLKLICKKQLLTLVLLLSFFALTGYVNSNRPAGQITNTELPAGKLPALKTAISYKRAYTLFYKNEATAGCIWQKSQAQLVLKHTRLGAGRYFHQKRLFCSYKNKIDSRFIPIQAMPHAACTS